MSNTIRGRERGISPRPAPGQTRRDAAQARSRAGRAAVLFALMRVGAPVLAFLAIAFAVAGIPTRHEALLFDHAPPCSAVSAASQGPEGPVSRPACRDEVSSAVTAVTFHPRQGKQGAYTDLSFDVGSTQSLDGDRTGDVFVGDEATVTLWKGHVTDFALHRGAERHRTNADPYHIADSRAATAAILLCLAVLAWRAALWRRLVERVRAARFALADGVLAVMLVATCVIAAARQPGAELAGVTATVLAAGSSTAMGRLGWVRAGTPVPRAEEAGPTTAGRILRRARR